jgi:GntR family histidine utilization transcriptional repressor
MSAPLHERIRGDIERRILSGALAPGDRLPTERDFMVRYGCSRMTVSKSLSALATAGLVDRRKRAGSFVARPRLHSMVLDVPDLPQEVLRRGEAYAYRMTERRIWSAGAARDPGLDAGPGRLLEIAGVHLAGGRPLAFERRRVSLTTVPAIEQAAFDIEPPGTWLLRHVPWTDAETRIAAIGADPATALLLEIETGAPILSIERRTWRGADCVTAVRQCFRGSSYDLVARFGARSVPK